MKDRKKLYIARDIGEDDEDNTNHKGNLHIFYDTPELYYGKWINARKIADIPSYMYPEIEDGQCCCFKEYPTSEQIYQKYKEVYGE